MSKSRLARVGLASATGVALLAACGGGGASLEAPAGPSVSTSAACVAKRGVAGADVVLLIGQSNMSGYGAYIVPGFDTTDPRIHQFTQASTVVPAVDPLLHPDAPFNTDRIGPGMSFARRYLSILPAERRLLLVPAAYAGTSFSGANWNPGNELFEAAVARTNAALATNPGGNCLAAILWSQGESDVGRMSGPVYQAALDTMINALRSRLTTSQSGEVQPMVLGQFSPDWTGPVPSAQQQAILDVINATPTRLRYTAIASTAGLKSNTTQGLNGAIHLDAASHRIYGVRFFDALATAMGNSAPR